ncbi:uncharacterized protein OCT59_003698 [Rhizophagus irregularis]|uniref:Uncharacterized protein n=1 Tax=Rhizophagus irregularis (strain DAOM 197198w) TaxID=1432141 RepID=A0A015MJB4_RHIIW|nr:hypothetical protein RirG_118800 [Rhizophagus irregularis DAOM 197198w]UZO12150.1 hypothetical protein OCT59_003698 [Rhizophagus irregularis]
MNISQVQEISDNDDDSILINHDKVPESQQQNNSDDDLESALMSLLSKKNKNNDLKSALKSLLSKEKIKDHIQNNPTDQPKKDYFRLDLSSIEKEQQDPNFKSSSNSTKQPFNGYYDPIDLTVNNQVHLNKSENYQGIKRHYDDSQKDNITWQRNKDYRFSPKISTVEPIASEYSASNKETIEVSSENVSDMCDEMKIMFLRSRNPGSAAVAAVAKILLPERGKNNQNIKFLKARGLEYMAQHHSRFNNDLSFYAEEYMKIKNISSPNEINEDEITSYISDAFFRDIFFTQFAIIRDDELFDDQTIFNSLKMFLKEAFTLHLKLEISRLNNPKIDNHYTLQQIKELDYLTSSLIIPNLTQKNAANQINFMELYIEISRCPFTKSSYT